MCASLFLVPASLVVLVVHSSFKRCHVLVHKFVVSDNSVPLGMLALCTVEN